MKYAPSDALAQASSLTLEKLGRLGDLGLTLSKNDRGVTLVSQFLALLGPVRSPDTIARVLADFQETLEKTANSISKELADASSDRKSNQKGRQLALFSLSN